MTAAKDDVKAVAEEQTVVTGAAAVLRLSDGTERTLYRGAPVVESDYDKASVKHHTDLGLIGKLKK